MSNIVTICEKWSARRLELTDKFRAYREFTVDGPDNETDALGAVDTVSGDSIPDKNDGHPLAPETLYCDGPTIKSCEGPRCWTIGCSYSDQSTGFSAKENLTRVGCETVEVSLPVDCDLDHRAILDGAGQPITGTTRRTTYKRLTLEKKFPYMDWALCTTYENATNDRSLTFAGMTIAAQHLRINSVNPSIVFTHQTKQLPVTLQIDVVLDDSMGTYPFQTRVLNAGQSGWYNDSGTKQLARFSDGRGNVLGLDIRLDEFGIPLPGHYSNIKVGDENRAPVSPPSNVVPYKVEYFSGDGKIVPAANNSTQACFFYYKESRVIDVSPLLQLFS